MEWLTTTSILDRQEARKLKSRSCQGCFPWVLRGGGATETGEGEGGDEKPSCFPPVPAVASPSFLTLSSLVADSIFTPPFPLISVCLEHPFLFGGGLLLYVEDDLILRALLVYICKELISK